MSTTKEPLLEKTQMLVKSINDSAKGGFLQKIKTNVGIDKGDLDVKERDYIANFLQKAGVKMEDPKFELPFLYYWMSGKTCTKYTKDCEDEKIRCMQKSSKEKFPIKDCDPGNDRVFGDIYRLCEKASFCNSVKNRFISFAKKYGDRFKPFFQLSNPNRDAEVVKQLSKTENPYTIVFSRTYPGGFDIFYFDGDTPQKKEYVSNFVQVQNTLNPKCDDKKIDEILSKVNSKEELLYIYEVCKRTDNLYAKVQEKAIEKKFINLYDYEVPPEEELQYLKSFRRSSPAPQTTRSTPINFIPPRPWEIGKR
jgi:hypothetical protein